jgi:dethiobiotin synthetase
MLHLPSPSYAGRNLHAPRGLIVTGVQARCGKTVVCAGLAGVMRELGFLVQAIKPMVFLSPTDIRKGYEQAYFDRITSFPNEPGSRQNVEVFSTHSPHTAGTAEWKHLVSLCHKRGTPYVLETPGNLATPIRASYEETLDVKDLADALALPVLLVAQKQADILSVLPPVLAYAAYRGIPLIGWVAVETSPVKPASFSFDTWQEDLLYLSRCSNIPYLGEIPFSPSISVETFHQGNLFRLTEMGLDLFPIQQALDVAIPLFN